MTKPIARGAAAFAAGLGPAGHDPPTEPDLPPEQEPIEALQFDPYDRVYVQNADLTMVAGSGPIQRAAILLLPRGALPATSTSGFPVDDVKRASPAQRRRVIMNALRQTWKTLLETQQIAIEGLEIEPTPNGGVWSGRFYPIVRDLTTDGKPQKLTGKV